MARRGVLDRLVHERCLEGLTRPFFTAAMQSPYMLPVHLLCSLASLVAVSGVAIAVLSLSFPMLVLPAV